MQIWKKPSSKWIQIIIIMSHKHIPECFCSIYKKVARTRKNPYQNLTAAIWKIMILKKFYLDWTSSFPLILFITHDMPALTPVITAKLRACTNGPPERAYRSSNIPMNNSIFDNPSALNRFLHSWVFKNFITYNSRKPVTYPICVSLRKFTIGYRPNR